MPDTNSPGVTKAELAAVQAAMPTLGQTITTYGPAAGAKVSVIMLPDSGA